MNQLRALKPDKAVVSLIFYDIESSKIRSSTQNIITSLERATFIALCFCCTMYVSLFASEQSRLTVYVEKAALVSTNI